MNTIQDVSQGTLKLESLLGSVPTGSYFSYTQLEQLTSIRMDNKGKACMRSALHRLKMPYETVKGQGVRLVHKDNASKIIVQSVSRIDGAAKKAEKVTQQVKDRVYNELSEPEQRNINFLGALFATIRSYSQSGKKIFNNEPLKVGQMIS